MKKITLLLLVFSMSIFSTSSFAQSRKEKLQQEQKKILEEIDEIKASIREAESKKTQSVSQLQSLKRKIEKRQQLISNINVQLENIEGEIETKTSDIIQFQNEIKVLKHEYAKIIAMTYKKSSSFNELMFIFSADNFNQAIARMKYMRKYSEYRNQQARKISKAIAQLKENIEVLNKVKNEKTYLLDDNKKQNNNLIEEKVEQDMLVKKLKTDIEKLRSEQNEKNKASLQLRKQIEKIIQDEIRKRREKRERERKEKERQDRENGIATPPKKVEKDKDVEEFAPTPEELALQNDFTSNKGKLPWPVAKGYIVEQFGRHSHPLDPELIIDKLGIDIKTTQGADIRAVYSGKVISIFTIPGMQQCVMIEHGKYITVYSHLNLVYVRAGESVNTKEVIGKVYYNEKEDEAITEFQIWNGQTKLDPEGWIAPK